MLAGADTRDGASASAAVMLTMLLVAVMRQNVTTRVNNDMPSRTRPLAEANLQEGPSCMLPTSPRRHSGPRLPFPGRIPVTAPPAWAPGSSMYACMYGYCMYVCTYEVGTVRSTRLIGTVPLRTKIPVARTGSEILIHVSPEAWYCSVVLQRGSPASAVHRRKHHSYGGRSPEPARPLGPWPGCFPIYCTQQYQPVGKGKKKRSDFGFGWTNSVGLASGLIAAAHASHNGPCIIIVTPPPSFLAPSPFESPAPRRRRQAVVKMSHWWSWRAVPRMLSSSSLLQYTDASWWAGMQAPISRHGWLRALRCAMPGQASRSGGLPGPPVEPACMSERRKPLGARRPGVASQKPSSCCDNVAPTHTRNSS